MIKSRVGGSKLGILDLDLFFLEREEDKNELIIGPSVCLYLTIRDGIDLL